MGIKKNKGKIKERITGIDLMLKICEKSQDYNCKIFLYGAKQENIEMAKKEIEKSFPKINVVDFCNGYEEEKVVIEKIQKSNADIVFVGLGSPKQEEFIIKNKENLKNVKTFMPVGGSFDVIGKTKKRAPQWMIKRNLEWLYRLIKEPRRALRQTKIIKYVIYIIMKKDGRVEKNEKN